jgi:hypothetical protein
MAITINSQPALHTGAFGINTFEVTTSDSTVEYIRYRLKEGSTVLVESYCPVIDDKAYFNATPFYSSVMITAYAGWSASVTNAFTTMNPEFQADHEMNITDEFHEVTSGVASSPATATRTIYRAVNVRYGIEYSTTNGLIALEKTPISGGITYRYVTPNQFVPLVMYSPQGGDMEWEGSGFPGTSIIEQSSGTKYSYMGVWKVPASPLGTYQIADTSRIVKFPGATGSTGNDINVTYYTDTKCYNNYKILYFQNQYGGWDFYDFIDFEEKYITSKNQFTTYSDLVGTRDILQQNDGRERELKLYGRPGTYNSLYYIRDLITSPIVLDESLTKVRVIDSDIRLRNGNEIIYPEVTIRYVKENTIKY